MPDDLTKERPASHDLFHAAVAARVELHPLASLIRSADIDPSMQRTVLQSLARLHGQLGDAIERFNEECGEEISRTSWVNAMAVFGDTITKEDHGFSSWHRCYVACLKIRYGHDAEPPQSPAVRAHYDAGKTPLEALS